MYQNQDYEYWDAKALLVIMLYEATPSKDGEHPKEHRMALIYRFASNKDRHWSNAETSISKRCCEMVGLDPTDENKIKLRDALLRVLPDER